MTRETKIGLLVGLAFIIIVGILLGDSVRHATDVQPASLPQVAQNVRNAVTTPGTAVSAPISMQGGNANATPQQTVLTREEVLRPQNGGVVIIGPGKGNTLQSNLKVNSRGAEVGEESTALNSPAGNQDGAGQRNGTAGDRLHEIARLNGEELVGLGNHPDNGQSRQTRPDNTLALAKGKTYQAGPGDSLGKIAARFYGSSAKPMRDAIVSANPSLKQNPDRILAGVTYAIPAIETSTGMGAAAQPTPQPAPPLPASRGGTGIAAVPQEYWYTVKENDNLWRIARDQVGDPAAVSALKELNKDLLKGGETVRINMKLRLPGKPVN